MKRDCGCFDRLVIGGGLWCDAGIVLKERPRKFWDFDCFVRSGRRCGLIHPYLRCFPTFSTLPSHKILTIFMIGPAIFLLSARFIPFLRNFLKFLFIVASFIKDQKFHHPYDPSLSKNPPKRLQNTYLNING